MCVFGIHLHHEVPYSVWTVLQCRSSPLAWHCIFCRMYIGTDFALMTDYSGLGEVNNIIILYPQAINNTDNLKGCWDW